MRTRWLATLGVVVLGSACSSSKNASPDKSPSSSPTAAGATPGAPGAASPAPTAPTPASQPGTPTKLDAGGSTPGSPAPTPVAPTCTGKDVYPAYVSDAQLCVYVYAQGLGGPRQMAFAPNGDLFVDNGSVTVLWDDNHDGSSDMSERSTFASASGIRHGLAFSRDGKWVYASSETTVYRWAYESGMRTAKGTAEVVIKNIPGGGHNTRTLVFDSTGKLIVAVGSASNLDNTKQQWDTRSQLRRFSLPASIPQGGVDYGSGQVVASGMRNEVGLFMDEQDRIWGVENGRDDLTDADFGGDIHTDNPAEEINLVDGHGSSFYGYPHCYTERNLKGGKGMGTQWADQTLDSSIQKTDSFCQDAANVHPPAFAMQGHWAPLGIVKYTGQALPFTGDFIITAHGSWDRQPAVGRLLARAHVQNDAVVSVEPIVGERDNQGQLKQGSWDARPVDVQQGPDQALYFSDDQGGRVFKVGYKRN